MLQKMFVFLAVFSTVVFAGADRVNFAGEWTFDKENSKLGEFGDRFVPSKIKIAQEDNKMSVERVFQREYEDDFVMTVDFTLDGKENESEFWNSPRITVAEWSEDGKKLTIKTKITFNREGEEFEMNSTDVWSLSDDGKQLTTEFSSVSDRGEMEAVYIFKKAEAKNEEKQEEKKEEK